MSEHISPSLSTVTPQKTNRTLQTTVTSSKSGLIESPHFILSGNKLVDQEELALSQTPSKAGVDEYFILRSFYLRSFIDPNLSQRAKRKLQAAKLLLPSFPTLYQTVKYRPIIQNHGPRKHRWRQSSTKRPLARRGLQTAKSVLLCFLILCSIAKNLLIVEIPRCQSPHRRQRSTKIVFTSLIQTKTNLSILISSQPSTRQCQAQNPKI